MQFSIVQTGFKVGSKHKKFTFMQLENVNVAAACSLRRNQR